MKKTIFLMLVSLVLIGCGINCKGEPPKKAKYLDGGGQGMMYHFQLSDPQGDAQHTPGKCTNYIYTRTDLYSDDLGYVDVDSVIWIDVRGNVAYPIEQKNQMKIFLSKEKVVISGHTGDYAYLNGEYPIK